MRRLSARHKRFAEAFVFGSDEGPPGCAAAAYRAATGRTERDNQISASAAKMLRTRGVQMEIERLQAEACIQAPITVDMHIRRLMRICDAAMHASNYGAAVRAERSIGEVCGFYVARRFNLNVDADSGVDPEARLRYLCEAHPALRDMLARMLGVELPADVIVESRALL